MRALPKRAVLSAFLATTFVLSGCLPIAATGVAVSALAVTDRRSVGAQTEDTEIEIKMTNRLASAVKEWGGVSITSYNRRVLLTGQVPDAQSKKAVEEVARVTPGVVMVHNELEVGPRASLTAETRDAALTLRIKSSFLEQRALSTNLVKVVTESDVVYLMGLVTQREAPGYAQVASRVSGVRRVVTLFQYLTEEELKRLEP